MIKLIFYRIKDTRSHLCQKYAIDCDLRKTDYIKMHSDIYYNFILYKNLIGDMTWVIFGGIYVTGRCAKKNEDSLPVGKQTVSSFNRTVLEVQCCFLVQAESAFSNMYC